MLEPLLTDALVHVVGTDGQHHAMTAAQMLQTHGENAIVPERDFAIHWLGSTLQFRQGVPAVVTDPALLAALEAAGAPFYRAVSIHRPPENFQ